MSPIDRRLFIKAGIGAGAGYVAMRYLGAALPKAVAADGPYGALLAADGRGIQLPAGFISRVVATSGKVVTGTTYTWHGAPDGGACFPTANGGWIYVSNSELSSGGGAGALRFNASGGIVGAQRILSGTSRNCAGGATPWGTWLSCEETGTGRVWECDPTGANAAVVRPLLGSFNHEAAACDPVSKVVYLTEDTTTGKLRRFHPTTWGDLSSGVLEAAVVSGGTVTWTTSINNGTAFNGGEGAWCANGRLWFTTKGDNRVWELNANASPNTIKVIYDDSTSPTPSLTGVDNIVGSVSGDLFIAEDGGNMELVMLEPDGAVSPFLRVLNQSGSEIAGPAFSPDGRHLYFSSQRGGTGTGITYEVTGPFRGTTPPTTTTTSPTITLSVAPRVQPSGKKFADLVWTGAVGANVEVRRNGALVATTPNDGKHADPLGKKTGTFSYTVSGVGGSPVSNTVNVTF